MNVFGRVKASINTREAAARYGVEVNRHGKALCPFHNDRHPSLFVDDDHYHCYACGEHGDVIDFTAKLFGLKLYEAAQKLAYDFGITQDKPPDKAMQEKQNRKSEAQRLRENEKLCFSALLEYMKLLQEWKRLYAPRSPEDTQDDRFVEACHTLDYVEYLVDLLIMGDSYERTEVIDMLMTDGKLQKLQKHLEKARKEESILANKNFDGMEKPSWYDGKMIDEVAFCASFLHQHPMKCVRNRLFTVDGMIEDEGKIQQMILDEVMTCQSISIAKKSKKPFRYRQAHGILRPATH